MGDRANVQFIWNAEDPDKMRVIDLYDHWGGASLAAHVVDHLGSDVARARWGDPSYCCRIVVQRTMNDCFDPNTDAGGGLSPYMDDNEHAVLELFMDDQTYSFGPSSGTWEELCALNPDIVRAMAG